MNNFLLFISLQDSSEHQQIHWDQLMPHAYPYRVLYVLCAIDQLFSRYGSRVSLIVIDSNLQKLIIPPPFYTSIPNTHLDITFSIVTSCLIKTYLSFYLVH